MHNPRVSVIRRLTAHGLAKVLLGCLLTVAFCAGYFSIGRHPVREPLLLEPTLIDQWVPFAPRWVWVYQSVYLLLAAAWLCETTDQLRRYATGFVLLTSVGFACFLIWPVAGPRPPVPTADSMYNLLIRYDTTLNSFPSLHMALAVYSASVAVRFTSGRSRRRAIFLLSVWVALIGYATLATKQHYWVDLPPGFILGWLAHYISSKRFQMKAGSGAFAGRGAE